MRGKGDDDDDDNDNDNDDDVVNTVAKTGDPKTNFFKDIEA